MKLNQDILSQFFYYYKTKYVAENGNPGGSNKCYGRGGADLVLKVPLGTVIKDRKTGGIIADMFTDGQRKVVLVGGEGGKGNAKFANSRRRAPHFSQTPQTLAIFMARAIFHVSLL